MFPFSMSRLVTYNANTAKYSRFDGKVACILKYNKESKLYTIQFIDDMRFHDAYVDELGPVM